MGSRNRLGRFLFSFFFFFQKRDCGDFKNALFRMSPKSSHWFFMLSRVKAQLWLYPSLLSVVRNICMYSSENKSHLSALFGKLV